MNEDKKDNNTSSMYRFGDNKESKAIQNVVTPVVIGKNPHMMLADVVKNNIHLMTDKRINEVTWYEADFLNDTAYTGDTFIPVMCSTTGHFSLPLIKWDQKLKIQILFSILNILVIYKQNKKIKKIQVALADYTCFQGKPLKLVKESKRFINKEFLKFIEEYCDNCQYAKNIKDIFKGQ